MISMHNNIAADAARRYLGKVTHRQRSALGELSTGLRVHRAHQGAAELAISEQLKANLRSTAQAQRNAMDGISAMQIADGALNEVHALLGRMRELAVHSANGTLGSTERGMLDTEFQQLKKEVKRIALVTTFGESKLLVQQQVDVGFVVDASASMGGLLNTLKSSVSDFRNTFVSLGFDVDFALAAVNTARDGTDGVARLSNFEDGSFETQLNAFTLNGGSMDPYSALLNTSGEADVSGSAEPDAFSWRRGSERVMIYLTDTGREAQLITTTEGAVATALADRGIKVHVIGPRNANDEDDAVPGSDLDGLASGTGGTYFATGGATGANIPDSLDGIVQDLSDLLGTAPISLQVDIGAASAHQMETGLPIDSRPAALGIQDSSVGTVEDALNALAEIDTAIEVTSTNRANIGAQMRSLEVTVTNLAQRQEGQASAISTLVDADIADATARLAKTNILSQLGVSVLAQAQSLQRDMVLSLLSF